MYTSMTYSEQRFYVCSTGVFDYFLNIPTHAPIIYTLKSTNWH